MPFNELKIDKHFVLESVKNEDARLIVRTVIDLARSLGIRACAEGVETEECLRVLRSLGCNCAQGYLFSKPVPAAELSGVLTQVGGALVRRPDKHDMPDHGGRVIPTGWTGKMTADANEKSD
jgi:EAL domain-containing protein (putative c-di-GMP-specific phosphodiesterase class I)